MDAMDAPDQALDAILQRLYRRHTFGIKLGLHVEEALLERLGNPHRDLACIHVAGTNGKGSVCAMLDAIVTAAGYRTGRYTSPHLIRFNERICIGGHPIPDADLLPLVTRVERESDAVTASLNQEPTFFEVGTAMALDHFREQAVDIALIEVGMGGRLDATNVVTPLVSVITCIGLEHTRYLGPDIETIAAEKAGIIKAGRPVVSGVDAEPARGVIRTIAAQRGAACVESRDLVSVQLKSSDVDGQKVVVETVGGLTGSLRLALLGEHQLDNLSLSLAVVDMLNAAGAVEVPFEAVRQGAASVTWPGRLQPIRRDPLTLVDGGHNPAAGRRVAKTMRKLAGGRPVGLVCGFCEDKDARGFLAAFAGHVARAWLVPISEARNMPIERLRAAAGVLECGLTEADVVGALDAAQRWAQAEDGVVLVAGSLFLAGEVLAMADL
jgi:dihydrofolate synthase/folylpolyglutamate synthase